jgi:hypothetical protein
MIDTIHLKIIIICAIIYLICDIISCITDNKPEKIWCIFCIIFGQLCLLISI